MYPLPVVEMQGEDEGDRERVAAVRARGGPEAGVRTHEDRTSDQAPDVAAVREDPRPSLQCGS